MWGLPAATKQLLTEAGIAPVDLNELIDDDASTVAFHSAITAGIANNKFGASVHAYTPEEYRGMRLFLSPDGTAGRAIKADGDMVSSFVSPGASTGAMHMMLNLGTQLGGRKSDCFDTVLPEYYSRHGMVPVARLLWNDAYAPEGWDYNTYARYNNGRPDVIFMVYDPDNAHLYREGEAPYVATYEEGAAAQNEAIARIWGQGKTSSADPLVTAIKRVYRSNKLLEILANFGPFDGGCLICAKALIRAADGGTLVRIVSHHDDPPETMTQHYGAEIDGTIYDFGGAFHTPDAWIKFFCKAEHVDYPCSFATGYDEGDIPDDPWKEKAVAQLLTSALTAGLKKATLFQKTAKPIEIPEALINAVSKMVFDRMAWIADKESPEGWERAKTTEKAWIGFDITEAVTAIMPVLTEVYPHIKLRVTFRPQSEGRKDIGQAHVGDAYATPSTAVIDVFLDEVGFPELAATSAILVKDFRQTLAHELVHLFQAAKQGLGAYADRMRVLKPRDPRRQEKFLSTNYEQKAVSSEVVQAYFDWKDQNPGGSVQEFLSKFWMWPIIQKRIPREGVNLILKDLSYAAQRRETDLRRRGSEQQSHRAASGGHDNQRPTGDGEWYGEVMAPARLVSGGGPGAAGSPGGSGLGGSTADPTPRGLARGDTSNDPGVRTHLPPPAADRAAEVAGKTAAWQREPVTTPWVSGQPGVLRYLHNTAKAPKVDWADQDVEPAGFYCIEGDPGVPAPAGWVEGEANLRNPLVLPWGGGYGTATNWKHVLSEQFGQKSGRELSQALIAAGHDAVITLDSYGTSEIVLLMGKGKTAAEGEHGPDAGEHGETTDETGQFFGDAGAGCVFVAADTGRVLLSYRSKFVNEPHTWGVWGGAIDDNEDPKAAAEREVREETSHAGAMELERVFVFKKEGFTFTTFLAHVESEFTPKLDWETEGYRWCSPGSWPAPIHFGLAAALPAIEKALGGKLPPDASGPGGSPKTASIDFAKAWREMVADRGPEFEAEITERAQRVMAGVEPELADLPQISWSYPTDAELLNELRSEFHIEKLFVNALWPKDKEYAEALLALKASSKPVDLDPRVLAGRHLWNTYGDLLKTVKNFGGPKDPESMLAAIKAGKPLPMPMVVHKLDGSMEVTGGNTRSGIAALAGQTITALVIDVAKANHALAEKIIAEAAEDSERKDNSDIYDAVHAYFLADGPKPTYTSQTDLFYAFRLGMTFVQAAKLLGIDVSDKESRFEAQNLEALGGPEKLAAFKRRASEGVVAAGEFTIPPKLLPHVKVVGGLASANLWHTKVWLGNSGTKDHTEVTTVAFDPKTSTIVPIAGSDEHQNGWEVIQWLQNKDLIPRLPWVLLNLKINFVDTTNPEEIQLCLNTYKAWRRLGGANFAVNSRFSRRGFLVSADDFIKAKGNPVHDTEGGKLSPGGARLVAALEALGKAYSKAHLGGIVPTKVLVRAGKAVMDSMDHVRFAHLLGWADYENAHTALSEMEAGEGPVGFETAIFSHNGLKNQIHMALRAYGNNSFKDEALREFFGDPELARAEFDRLGAAPKPGGAAV